MIGGDCSRWLARMEWGYLPGEPIRVVCYPPGQRGWGNYARWLARGDVIGFYSGMRRSSQSKG